MLYVMNYDVIVVFAMMLLIFVVFLLWFSDSNEATNGDGGSR